jgi:hypothetical protein
MVAGLLPGLPAQARQAKARPPHVQHDKVVQGHDMKPRRLHRAVTVREFTAPVPRWPAATTVNVRLGHAAAPAKPKPYGPGRKLFALAPAPVATVRAGTSPVFLTPVGTITRNGLAHPGALSLSAAQVRVFSHADATRAGIHGMLLSVARTDGVAASGRLRVTVDYSAFKGAYGGDYANRLHLVELVGCRSATPVPTRCREVVLPTVNDWIAASLSATVNVASPSRPTILAAASTGSGGTGSFSATTLSPSGSWSVGGSTGDFQWSYPLRTPPGLGGQAPKLMLTYDSASVDGEMATSGELIQDSNNPNRWHLRGDDGTSSST